MGEEHLLPRQRPEEEPYRTKAVTKKEKNNRIKNIIKVQIRKRRKQRETE